MLLQSLFLAVFDKSFQPEELKIRCNEGRYGNSLLNLNFNIVFSSEFTQAEKLKRDCSWAEIQEHYLGVFY